MAGKLRSIPIGAAETLVHGHTGTRPILPVCHEGPQAISNIPSLTNIDLTGQSLVPDVQWEGVQWSGENFTAKKEKVKLTITGRLTIGWSANCHYFGGRWPLFQEPCDTWFDTLQSQVSSSTVSVFWRNSLRMCYGQWFNTISYVNWHLIRVRPNSWSPAHDTPVIVLAAQYSMSDFISIGRSQAYGGSLREIHWT